MLLDHAEIPAQLPLGVEEADAEILVVFEAVELLLTDVVVLEVALVFVDVVVEGAEPAPPQALTDQRTIN